MSKQPTNASETLYYAAAPNEQYTNDITDLYNWSTKLEREAGALQEQLKNSLLTNKSQAKHSGTEKNEFNEGIYEATMAILEGFKDSMVDVVNAKENDTKIKFNPKDFVYATVLKDFTPTAISSTIAESIGSLFNNMIIQADAVQQQGDVYAKEAQKLGQKAHQNAITAIPKEFTEKLNEILKSSVNDIEPSKKWPPAINQTLMLSQKFLKILNLGVSTTLGVPEKVRDEIMNQICDAGAKIGLQIGEQLNKLSAEQKQSLGPLRESLHVVSVFATHVTPLIKNAMKIVEVIKNPVALSSFISNSAIGNMIADPLKGLAEGVAKGKPIDPRQIIRDITSTMQKSIHSYYQVSENNKRLLHGFIHSDDNKARIGIVSEIAKRTPPFRVPQLRNMAKDLAKQADLYKMRLKQFETLPDFIKSLQNQEVVKKLNDKSEIKKDSLISFAIPKLVTIKTLIEQDAKADNTYKTQIKEIFDNLQKQQPLNTEQCAFLGQIFDKYKKELEKTDPIIATTTQEMNHLINDISFLQSANFGKAVNDKIVGVVVGGLAKSIGGAAKEITSIVGAAICQILKAIYTGAKAIANSVTRAPNSVQQNVQNLQTEIEPPYIPSEKQVIKYANEYLMQQHTSTQYAPVCTPPLKTNLPTVNYTRN